MTGRELVDRLLDVTPAPMAGARVDELLSVFEAVMARRAEILAAVAAPVPLSDPDRPRLAELTRRQDAWQDALAAALRQVGEQRRGASQLRAYGGRR
ncbi:MAG TPA: hypothetical protein VHW23_28000 [Kofleriaceae bacterium]|jgi:hypothetical protein|nr:hypothetical protein [Kofleriaceae bacterium]